MKVTMTREQAFNLFFVLTQNFKDENGEKYNKYFNFAAERNIVELKPEIALIIKARETNSEAFKEFLKVRDELLVSEAKRDEQNNPIIVNNKYVYESPEVENKILKQLDFLKNKYKDAIDQREKEVSIYNQLVTEATEYNICQCSFKYLPDKLSRDEQKILKPMIRENEEEIIKILEEEHG